MARTVKQKLTARIQQVRTERDQAVEGRVVLNTRIDLLNAQIDTLQALRDALSADPTLEARVESLVTHGLVELTKD